MGREGKRRGWGKVKKTERVCGRGSDRLIGYIVKRYTGGEDMSVLITLLHLNKIYHAELQEKMTVTFGSHKKDSVTISEMNASQISVKLKNDKITVDTKLPMNLKTKDFPKGEIVILYQESKTAILITDLVECPDQILKLPYQASVSIGRRKENNVLLPYPYISGKHCMIRSEAGILHVEDLKSTNGVYLNGTRITKAVLKSGDMISLLNVRIIVKDSCLYFKNMGKAIEIHGIHEEKAYENKADIEKKGCSIKYKRSPRTQAMLPDREIVLASAPTKAAKFEKSRGMLASLIGSGAMVASSLTMGAASPALLAARAAMLVMPVSSAVSMRNSNGRRKKKLEEYELLRQKKYFEYISEQKARIDAVAQQQRNILTRENPAPVDCLQCVINANRNLWERMPGDRDFLDVRVGMGYEELCVPVKTRSYSGTISMEEDEILEMSEQLIEETRIVDNVPARISLLKNSSVGVIGNRSKVISLVKNMLVALTTQHSYQDVHIVGIFDEEEQKEWEDIRWLPHFWDENKQTRYLAFSQQDAHKLCEYFHEIVKQRKREMQTYSYNKAKLNLPCYVFIFGSKRHMEQEQIMSDLFLDEPALGISSLFLFDDLYSLPHDCKMIVDVNDGPSAYLRNEVNNKFIFTMDHDLKRDDYSIFARRMSAIELEGFAISAPIPKSVTFLQGYGVQGVEQLDVERRWVQSRAYDSLAAPIGVLGGGKTFSLDIHEKAHGPHGLVAGTTGSGKSELLQTWILSMALNYHPYDVSFVIIDYKGGGMANLLEPLPHVVGKITNIGSNIGRSLVSLQSEIKRRMRLFDQAGVNHIDKYQKKYKEDKTLEPLPHLVIVADEFAELKKDEPEFMQGLIQTARVGRSLGIHMVLATQKPSGVVDDQIWSNTRFQLCLKVQSVSDSREMIKTPDAAQITQAGRAYVKVGSDEIYELFQSYWSGAPYMGAAQEEKEIGNQVRIVSMNGQRIKTVIDEKTRFHSEIDELKAVVHYICEETKRMNIAPLSGPWLPELPSRLYLTKDILRTGFDGNGWCGKGEWLRVPIGIFDKPESQQQGLQYIDFIENGHYAIFGAPSTGKTTLLKSVILALGMLYEPTDVSCYILDFGGWSMSAFADMPHVGGVVLDSEEEKISKLGGMLQEEIERRKRLFLQHTVSNISQYRTVVSADLPAVIIAIDNITPVFELYPDLEPLFVTIAREGAAYGIYLIFTTNSSSGVRYKIMQNVRGAVAFELTDKSDYPQIVGRLEGRKLAKVAGRAFMKGNPPMEFQAAIYMPGANDMEKVQNLKDTFSQMNKVWKGIRPKAIPVMPEHITLDQLCSQYQKRTCLPIGISYDSLETVICDMTEQYSFVVCGMDAAQNSQILLDIANIIHTKSPQDKIYIIDSPAGKMNFIQNEVYFYATSAQNDQMDQVMEEIVQHLNERKRAQNSARNAAQGVFDEQGFIQEYEQLCIFVNNLKEFVDYISDENLRSMERICRLAQGLGVLVFVSGLPDDLVKYNQIESLTRAIIANQRGITVEGTPAQSEFFQCNLKYSEKGENAGAGNAWYFENGQCQKIKIADTHNI